MIDLSNIKTILQVAGIAQLKISFDGELQIVNAEYVFRGKPGKKVITFQEIEIVLSIGQPAPSMSVAQRAGCVLDVKQELK